MSMSYARLHRAAVTATVRPVCAAVFLASVLAGCGALVSAPAADHPSNLSRAKTFLAAGDCRRAIEACQQEITEHPSARSYVYLVYVYQAVDAYVDALARADRWVQIEQLVLSLTPNRPEETLDPPNVLARMAKELIQESVRKQSDANAVFGERLDKPTVDRLWTQQKAWRSRAPDSWWLGVPPEWGW